jgi:CAAD domains of cyanobacterial aminoacyl-tRNA synthetase
MTNDIVQTNEYGEVIMETGLGEVHSTIEQPLLTAAPTTTESAEESWGSFQTQATNFFANATQSTVAFFRENRQLLITLGWIFLALLGIRVLFASLDAIDDVPLMSSLLKIIGLVSVVRFVWRYLLRATDRQELTQKVDQAKAELLGH